LSPSRYKLLDSTRTSLTDASKDHRLVSTDNIATPGSMPDVLAARDLETLAKALHDAKAGGASRIWGIGGHVIKTGVAPLIIDLIKRGFISAVAANGSVIIHDFEIAAFGATSEDVASTLDDGTFGMTRETGEFLNNAIKVAVAEDLGLGEAGGRTIAESDLPNRGQSVLGAAYEAKVPVTVHVAIGADVIHMHPSMDGAATGKASHTDFLILANEVSKLEGGVFINFGSAVMLPEVFLKALTLARNTGHKVDNFITANFDMYRHYRPTENVLKRPTRKGGQAFDFSGHHEIMLPLLYRLLTEGDAEA